MEYYIVSIKHTSKGDAALTLWGPNNAGYTWHKDRAGVYTEEQAKRFAGDENNVPVSKEVADTLFLPADDFGDKYVSLPNDTTVRSLLGLSDKHMNAKKYATCRMKFQPKFAGREAGEK